MKQIAIFGSYGGNSIGDTAILLGLISSLNRVFGDNITVNILTVAPLNLQNEFKDLNVRVNINEFIIHNKEIAFPSRLTYLTKILINKILYIFPFNKRKIKEALKKSDLLIIGGGNLIMDYYPKWPIELNSVCQAAKEVGIPYSIVGVGVGPLNSKNGRKLLNKCLIGAENVYFRDKNSKISAAKLLTFSESKLIPDLALGINTPQAPKQTGRTKRLLVNVAGVYDQYWPEQNKEINELYIDKLCTLTINLCKDLGIETIAIFTTNLADLNSTSKFVALLNARLSEVSIHFDSHCTKNVYELIKLSHNFAYVLSTRLHAGILATLGGCKVYAIAYQDKVRDVLEQLEIQADIININIMLYSNDTFDANKEQINNISQNTIELRKQIDNSIKNITEIS